jgi:hypothetical protein
MDEKKPTEHPNDGEQTGPAGDGLCLHWLSANFTKCIRPATGRKRPKRKQTTKKPVEADRISISTTGRQLIGLSYICESRSIINAGTHMMNKRPLSVTLIGCLFLVTGVIGLAYHATEFDTKDPFQYDLVFVCFVRFLAIVFALFMMRAKNWARWLLVAWIAFHVILSGFHSVIQLIVHSLLMALVTYFLFRPQSSAYFRHVMAKSAPMPTME